MNDIWPIINLSSFKRTWVIQSSDKKHREFDENVRGGDVSLSTMVMHKKEVNASKIYKMLDTMIRKRNRRIKVEDKLYLYFYKPSVDYLYTKGFNHIT